MGREVYIGSAIVDQFPVYAADGYTKVSGVAGFTYSVWKDAVIQAVVVTITEIGSSGEYLISFTPTSVGVWTCEVHIPTNDQMWYGEYTVKKSELEFSASMAEDGTTARFTVWGEDENGRATWLTGMTAEIRDSSGTLVASLGAGSGPSGDGTFLFTYLSSLLNYNVPYLLTIAATNGSITWNGNCGFVRVK
jgi:hypothetical protein